MWNCLILRLVASSFFVSWGDRDAGGPDDGHSIDKKTAVVDDGEDEKHIKDKVSVHVWRTWPLFCFCILIFLVCTFEEQTNCIYFPGLLYFMGGCCWTVDLLYPFFHCFCILWFFVFLWFWRKTINVGSWVVDMLLPLFKIFSHEKFSWEFARNAVREMVPQTELALNKGCHPWMFCSYMSLSSWDPKKIPLVKLKEPCSLP